MALARDRVSNLPTVWTNVLAGAAFGAEPKAGVVVPVALAASLLYVAGACLDEALDAKGDGARRPARPIPAGEVSARTAFAAAFGLMALGLAILWVGPGGDRAVGPGAALAALMALHGASHRRNPAAPLVMALSRVAVYVTAVRAAGPSLPPPLVVGSLLLFAYLASVALVARRETDDPKAPRLVGRLVAGISLVDGLQLLVLTHAWLAAACVGAFWLTRRLQRSVAAA